VANYCAPHTREQALVEALYRRLKAHGELEAQACDLLVEEFAVGLDEATVEQAKAHAQERYDVDVSRAVSWRLSH
jgi:hypothetical protein